MSTSALLGSRKEQILAAAADLVARRGYHSVAIADIGNAAGISGPGVYRHFNSKAAVLVALLDRVVDELLGSASRITAASADEQEILDQLMADQIQFTLTKRTLIQVYLQEIHSLPEQDQHRLRRKQRGYIDEWAKLLMISRPRITNDEARSLVHAAVSAIQSVVHYNSHLEQERLRGLMLCAAEAVLRAELPASP